MYQAILCAAMLGGLVVNTQVEEHIQEQWQLTHSVKNHCLDNNDNFSPDGALLCYDTREGVGPGIDNSQSIEMVDVRTGVETVAYAPSPTVVGKEAAPGVGAVSFSPVENRLVFIHGPMVDEVAVRGWYGKPNRRGATVLADGKGALGWLDFRDIARDRDTLPGAHRGGTHRHEYSLDGRRIGFTYDDFLLQQYDRTIGYMEPRPDAPGGVSHYFALLVKVVAKGTAKPGEIERADGDSWVGREGLMRAFIGKVRAEDGKRYETGLFVVDVPREVDITTADSGGADRFPSPPKGLTIRRLVKDGAFGIVRGSLQGDRIAYYALAPDKTKQVFIVASDGGEDHPDPAKRPVQVTHLPGGVTGGLRWHPSGNSILCLSDNGIVVACVQPGPLFGRAAFLTVHGDALIRNDVVFSPDGKRIAYDKFVQTKDKDGDVVKTYDGKDYQQIFLMDFPDANGDGIPDFFDSRPESSPEERRAELLKTLGKLPDMDRPITAVVLSSEDRDGFVLERLALDLNGLEPVRAYFVKPRNASGRLPVILYNHSHGGRYDIGKEELLAPRDYMQPISYAKALTDAGYSALCIDHWAFGDRSTRKESAVFKDMLLHGRVMWGMMVYDSLRALDYLQTRPDVDANRIGTLGMSMGSTMAWWVAALDTRVRTCVDICCLTELHALVEAGNLDGHGVYYYVPGLLEKFDTNSICGLIAPRPHLALAGLKDKLTPPDGLARTDAAMKALYAKLGCADAWRLETADGPHYETPEMRESVLRFLRDTL